MYIGEGYHILISLWIRRGFSGAKECGNNPWMPLTCILSWELISSSRFHRADPACRKLPLTRYKTGPCVLRVQEGADWDDPPSVTRCPGGFGMPAESRGPRCIWRVDLYAAHSDDSSLSLSLDGSCECTFEHLRMHSRLSEVWRHLSSWQGFQSNCLQPEEPHQCCPHGVLGPWREREGLLRQGRSTWHNDVDWDWLACASDARLW